MEQSSKVVSRRGFLGSAAGAVASGVAWSALSQTQVAGANERVNVAIIGCGGQGRFVLRVMIEEAGANCVCLCDLS